MGYASMDFCIIYVGVNYYWKFVWYSTVLLGLKSSSLLQNSYVGFFFLSFLSNVIKNLCKIYCVSVVFEYLNYAFFLLVEVFGLTIKIKIKYIRTWQQDEKIRRYGMWAFNFLNFDIKMD